MKGVPTYALTCGICSTGPSTEFRALADGPGCPAGHPLTPQDVDLDGPPRVAVDASTVPQVDGLSASSNLFRLEPSVIAHPSGLNLSPPRCGCCGGGWPLGDDRSASGGG